MHMHRWMTYDEADSTAEFFGKGMRTLGLNPGEKVLRITQMS